MQRTRRQLEAREVRYLVKRTVIAWEYPYRAAAIKTPIPSQLRRRPQSRAFRFSSERAATLHYVTFKLPCGHKEGTWDGGVHVSSRSTAPPMQCIQDEGPIVFRATRIAPFRGNASRPREASEDFQWLDICRTGIGLPWLVPDCPLFRLLSSVG